MKRGLLLFRTSPERYGLLYMCRFTLQHFPKCQPITFSYHHWINFFSFHKISPQRFIFFFFLEVIDWTSACPHSLQLLFSHAPDQQIFTVRRIKSLQALNPSIFPSLRLLLRCNTPRLQTASIPGLTLCLGPVLDELSMRLRETCDDLQTVWILLRESDLRSACLEYQLRLLIYRCPIYPQSWKTDRKWNKTSWWRGSS